jgi:arginine N-succinyltransferase
LIRQANTNDLEGVLRLAAIFNTVNLPNNEAVLADMLKCSEDSFSGQITKAANREYIFVMEDLEQEQIIGTSMAIAQHGHRDAPHIFFDVRPVQRYSETVDKLFKHKVLQLGFSYDGPTEIGGLVLDPKYRGKPGKLGKQLSFIRFLFMAMHRNIFKDRLLAELLPPFLGGNRSHLWEACGKRFTNLTYQEADKISKNNKEFIKGLFPAGPIHASLFANEAQDVIGKVGEATKGVQRMLENIGFHYVNRVDPFDGGPHFEANTDAIWPVKESQHAQAGIIDRKAFDEDAGKSAEGLVAVEDSEEGMGFRALYTSFRLSERAGKTMAGITQEAAVALQVKEGQDIWVLPFVWQTRR